ncbi:MAG: putative synthase protein [Polaromonas sp.]|nr:putative synthase protein [Polaromonas sp.]
MADAAAKYSESAKTAVRKSVAQTTEPSGRDMTDEAPEEGFKPLTHEEAKKIRQANPLVSLWAVLAGQAGVGILVALAAWGLTGQPRMGWSAAYGALAVVVPAALFARGLSRQKSAMQGNAALVGFFVWELVKIALTVAMLFAAPKLIAELNWLALLAGFVVTMKVYWVAMWFRPARKKSIKNFKN